MDDSDCATPEPAAKKVAKSDGTEKMLVRRKPAAENEPEVEADAAEEELKKVKKAPLVMKKPAAKAADEPEAQAEEAADKPQVQAQEDAEAPTVLRKPSVKAQKAGLEAANEPEAQAEEEVEAPTVMKKPAAKAHKAAEEAEPAAEAAEEELAAEAEEVNEEEVLAKKEQELTAARKKELKAMHSEALKEVVVSKGLEVGKKEEMIELLLACEAKERADAHEYESKIRSVLVKKKEELETTPMQDLQKLCASMDIRGVKSKADRVKQLLKKWQEDDGIDKALAQMAHDARKEELLVMDKTALWKLCDEIGVDPFVKEVMVDRIVEEEDGAGRFANPTPKEAVMETTENGDLVESLLEHETNRKKQAKLQAEQEEAVANKKKEFRAKTMDELKNLLTSKGLEPSGKKEDLVEALYAVRLQEEALNAKKNELKCMAVDDLKKLLLSKGLDTGKKDDMVETWLAYEAKCRQEIELYKVRVAEVLAKKREELEQKSSAELKDLCVSKGLKQGLAKEDRLERLLVEAEKGGEVEFAVAAIAREARRAELLTMDKSDLKQLCDKTGADPLVKEVLIERLLASESKAREPPAKKPRSL